ncbi:MAG: hypothetical protein D6785_10050 [Planctomycetota bacterium]|nr:MAG: hypothetical protein D6785_10050 [Planctomycetota bacterium]
MRFSLRSLIGLLLFAITLFGCNKSSSSGGGGISVSLPTAFNLTDPQNGTGISVTGTLYWQDSTGETSYRIEIFSDQNLNNIVLFSQLNQNTTSFTIPANALNKNQTYYWRVKAQNSAGETIAANAPFSFVTVGANTAVGVLDTSFDSDGIVTHDGAATVGNPGGNPGDDQGNSVIIIPSGPNKGKILVAGYSFNGADLDMTVWQYNTDGTLDTQNFGGSRGYYISGMAGEDRGQDLAVDSSGNIYVVGYSTQGGTLDITVWKLKPDGTLDTTFKNPNGFLTLGFKDANNIPTNDRGFGIVVDNSNSRIVFVGEGGNLLQILKYDFNGGADTTFGSNSNGNVTFNSGTIATIGRDVILDGSNNILVCGAYGSNMAVWRYTPSGQLDTTFNSGGTQGYFRDTSKECYGYGLVQDSNNNIIVCGYYLGTSNTRDMALWRLTSAGVKDTNFQNPDGRVTFNNAAGGNKNDEGLDVLIDLDGKIVVTGYSINSSNSEDMVIWRVHNDSNTGTVGSLDTATFGNPNGYVVHTGAAGGTAKDFGYGITIDSNGRLIVTGSSTNSSYNLDMVIWRWK